MTQPQAQAQPAKTEVLNVPPPTMPLCTRVWSKHPFNTSAESLMWSLNQQHPLVAELRVIRMYIIPGGAVEVYSTDTSEDNKKGGEVGVRNTIPWHEVRFIEEVMDAPIFVQEMIAAEEGDEEDEEEEEDDETPPAGSLQPLPPAPTPAPIPVNGQGGTS